MLFYVLRRLVAVVGMLLVVSMATFVLFFAAPEDPARLTCARNCTPAIVEGNRAFLGYDKPLTEQYANFLKGLVASRTFPEDPALQAAAPSIVATCAAPCLGYSRIRNQSVTEVIAEGLPVTASLALSAFCLWVVAGVTGGVVAALRRGTWVDRTVVGVALVGFSLPAFFLGLLLLTFVAIKWQLVPVPAYTPLTEDPFRWAQGLVLPAITLAFVFAASYVRLTRAYVLETMSEEYIRTARSKGVKESSVVLKHGLRAALTPLVTVAGLDLAALLGGAIVTETVFNFQGLGWTSVRAISETDLPLIVGIVVTAAFFVVVANLVVDIGYGLIDPRVRRSGR